ncbi:MULTISPECIES: hypothetical protein [Eikenella]|nr:MULTISPECIES: hypothetical protein [Eikenella]
MRKFLAVSLVLACGLAQAAPAERAYRFADYPSPIYQGARHPVQLTQQWRDMRTRIREGYQSGKIGFAGSYVAVTWGCGTQCLNGALVDARSGKIYELTPLSTDHPLNACYRADGSMEPDIFHYQAGSRLFITENCHYADIAGREDVVTQFKTIYVYQWLEQQKRFELLSKTVQRSSVPAEARY